ncbi:MAG: hypothetical protein HQK72_09710 [Desulfamplus sp.]|nr:hypothetical protein [Desulfamplus sp.]
MESLIVIIIVGCAVIYCITILKKTLTGRKQCNCSSSDSNNCQILNKADSKQSDSCSCSGKFLTL